MFLRPVFATLLMSAVALAADSRPVCPGPAASGAESCAKEAPRKSNRRTAAFSVILLSQDKEVDPEYSFLIPENTVKL